jgi:hypothetical protein
LAGTEDSSIGREIISMPQVWLSNLKQARPILAEFLQAKCADSTSLLTEKKLSYVLGVIGGTIQDGDVYQVFWDCIEYYKDEHEKHRKQ